MARTNVYRYYDKNDDYDLYEEHGDKVLDGWFDPDKAEAYDESTTWNGNNHISDATGGQWEHEILYRTKSGRWVLHHWSQWQGTIPTYRFVTDEQAREWLLRCGHDEAVARHFGDVEEERGPGRPEIGPAFSLRFPTDMLERLDARAKDAGTSRAAMIRRAVEEMLSREENPATYMITNVEP